MINKKNILIYPAGAENAINIYNSLKYNIHFNCYGASHVDNHATYIFDKEHYCEDDFSIKSPNFFENFNKMLNKFKIDFIMCTHDEVITFLMENEDKINAKICCSPLETTKVAFDKELTYEKFMDYNFCPKIYKDTNEVKLPVFLKPKHGAGGKGTCLVKTKEELIYQTKNNNDLLMCEFLPGNEYTVDCFTNRKGELILSLARTRERITNGIAYRSKKVENQEKFNEIAKQINEKLEFRGAWFFQLKEDENENLKLMEICVRQAGTMIYTVANGFNMSSLTIFDFMEQDITPIINNCNITLDRCIHNSFKLDYDYENIYIDFDDTLIINNQVNSAAMKFIYQSLNLNKNVYLLTKHAKNITESLNKYRISEKIFKEIIHIKENENKSSVIKKEKSIFIDNYFKERYEVYQKLNIPVFDVETIEYLNDDSKI